jgi:hypothetical protein
LVIRQEIPPAGRNIAPSLANGIRSNNTAGTFSGMSNNDKIRENRLRRMAKRQGLELCKSSRRDVHSLDYGTYALYHPATANWYRRSPSQYGVTLDEIETDLTHQITSTLAQQTPVVATTPVSSGDDEHGGRTTDS